MRDSESRVARLRRNQESRKKFAVRQPRLNRGAEMRTFIAFTGLVAALAAGLAIASLTGIAGPEDHTRIILAFAVGLATACGIASGITFLIALRHKLLLVAALALLAAAGSTVFGPGALETLAKIVFAASVGLWIALMLTSITQVLLISVLIIIVDFYSVFLGPTKKIVESGGPWLDYLTINLPALGTDAMHRLGISDIIFFSVFVGCTLTFRLRRTMTALALTASFLGTMVVGVAFDAGVPALPLLSLFFLLANGDLLYSRFLQEPGDGGNRPGWGR